MELYVQNAVHYHYDKFPPAKLDYESFIPDLLDATDALARYDQVLKGMHNNNIFLAPLRTQEAVISSRMEGTISTMDEILQYEADRVEDRGENDNIHNVRSEVIETYLYSRALSSAQHAIEEGQPFSQFLIKGIHQKLLSFGRGAHKSPGQFKNEQNYLADKIKKEILFIPISPEKLQDGMDNLFKYIEEGDHRPILKTAISHVEFEALHPFKDGNGRIGRMLTTLLLWKYGIISAPHFYISGYFEENKDLYIDTMRRVSSNSDWNAWCAFFLEAVKQQALKNLIVAENIQKLYEDMKNVFSEVLSSRWTISALDYIFTNPVFRNSKFTSTSGIPAQTASRFTKLLSEKNLLVTIQEASGRRAALYSFEPLMQLVRV
jgi:Fic family protein